MSSPKQSLECGLFQLTSPQSLDTGGRETPQPSCPLNDFGDLSESYFDLNTFEHKEAFAWDETQSPVATDALSALPGLLLETAQFGESGVGEDLSFNVIAAGNTPSSSTMERLTTSASSPLHETAACTPSSQQKIKLVMGDPDQTLAYREMTASAETPCVPATVTAAAAAVDSSSCPQLDVAGLDDIKINLEVVKFSCIGGDSLYIGKESVSDATSDMALESVCESKEASAAMYEHSAMPGVTSRTPLCSKTWSHTTEMPAEVKCTFLSCLMPATPNPIDNKKYTAISIPGNCDESIAIVTSTPNNAGVKKSITIPAATKVEVNSKLGSVQEKVLAELTKQKVDLSTLIHTLPVPAIPMVRQMCATNGTLKCNDTTLFKSRY